MENRLSCYICLDLCQSTWINLNCNHAFHLECIYTLFITYRKTTCPTCRAEDQDYYFFEGYKYLILGHAKQKNEMRLVLQRWPMRSLIPNRLGKVKNYSLTTKYLNDMQIIIHLRQTQYAVDIKFQMMMVF